MDYQVHMGDLLIMGLGAIAFWLIKSKFGTYDGYHTLHFKHADRTEIHQESMSKETLEARLDTLNQNQTHITDALEAHTAEDRRVQDEQKIETGNIRETVHWVGDCMVKFGAKMDIELPPRPQLRR